MVATTSPSRCLDDEHETISFNTYNGRQSMDDAGTRCANATVRAEAIETLQQLPNGTLLKPEIHLLSNAAFVETIAGSSLTSAAERGPIFDLTI